MSTDTGADGDAEADAGTGTEGASPGGSTQNLTLVQAVRDGIYGELARDEDVLVLGEDVGENGGVFRATQGLVEEFGDQRVVDTPLAESGIVGTAIGLAAFGMRPVAEVQFMGFLYPAYDQLVSHAARLRSRSRGRFTCPLVVRAPYGGGIRAPEHHSESTEAALAHIPGLKLVVPSTPRDAKGLLAAAVRSEDPVVFLEPKKIYRAFRGEVPDETSTLPRGEAAVRREGADVSVFTWGAMTRPTLDAAAALAEEGVDAEVVDLRTLSPMDRDTVRESFEKTGRAVVVHEAHRAGGLAGEITATLQEQVLYQEAPIRRVTGFDVPFPLYALEEYYLPEAERIGDAIRETVEY
jgi:pyruvate dehydrogenase E1 component beta subunit